MARHEAAEAGGAAPGAAARRRVLANRLLAAAAIALALVPSTSGLTALAWVAAALVLAGLEANPRRPELAPVMAVLCSVSYGAAAVLLWTTDLPAGRQLAAVMVMLNLLWLIMQHHARPRLFLAAAAPMFLLGVAGALHIALLCLRAGEPWLALPAAVSPALIAHFVLGARDSLARSQTALERARAQAEERGVAADAAARAKRLFLATMSHEIRTPLNGVLGMLQAMEADRLSAVQRERLRVARESGQGLAAILEDVLDLSSIGVGQLKLQSAEFDLAHLARTAAAAAAREAGAKGLAFHLEIAPEAAGTYRGDPRRIRQVLSKLVSNAVKFTEHGEVRLAVSRGEDEILRFAVHDTGQGISAKSLKKLFERFELVDASSTRRHGGAGIGLSIARELAQLMGGEVEASSQLGKGSEFTLTLPLPRVGEAAPAAVPRPRRAEPNLAQARVLAAEDNPMNQLVLKTLLGQHGIEPVVVDNGAEAVAAWRRGPFDVILMDVQMPEMDGPAAARAIRAEEAARGLPRTPIVALTANAMPYQVEEYLAAGMDQHVAKPVEAGLLYDAIALALRQPRARTDAAA
jgi:two-component system, sensor histidine kinase